MGSQFGVPLLLMTDLAGRVALVAGGAGAIGEGVVRAFLNLGARVVVPSRQAERLASLRERLGHPPGLHGLVSDIANLGGAERLVGSVAENVGPLDAVVAAVGGWWQNSLLVEVDPDEWTRVLDANLTTHFLLARALVPALRDRPGASYQMVIGDTAESPVPGASLSTVTAAGVLGLFRALSAEEPNVRVNSLYLGPVITRSRPKGPPEWLTADEVGAYSAWLATEAAAEIRGQLLRPPKPAAKP